ncbi:ATP-binding cassette domain-containing protein [Actinoplanes sp. NPDC000266]
MSPIPDRGRGRGREDGFPVRVVLVCMACRVGLVLYGYGAVTALQPIDLAVHTGTRHAIIGPNGAGKSTLLNVIAGSARPTSGRILFNSGDITRHGPARRARAGIGRTFQHPAVVGELTAADNIALAIRRPRPGVGGRAGQVRAALEYAGLAGDATTVAASLPYGRRRLLEIAMAMAGRPQLLLLDEPSAGLDPAEIEQLTAVITALPSTTGVVLVDHHLPLIWRLAGTVTVLASGRHIATGPTDEIREHPDVLDAYLPAATPATTDGLPTDPPGARKAVLTVEGLRAGYDGAPVLDSLDLSVDAATVYALLGRNGAGKSTVLNVLTGLHPAQPGTQIRLHGAELTPARRRDIALVPQGRRLWPHLTVGEHLRLAAARPGGGQAWDQQAVLELLPGLHGKHHRYPGQLSGGEQQMLAVARALLQRPRLLLLDEPSEGLAPRIVDQLAAAIARIAAAGTAVLLAEQNQHLAAAVADRVSVLHHGRIALSTRSLADSGTHHRLGELLGVAAVSEPA